MGSSTTGQGILHHRVAAVTGGSSGIGLAISREFLAAGASVLIVGRNSQRLIQAEEYLLRTASAIKRDKLGAIECDVTTAGSGQRIVAKAKALFAGLDILINNVGGPVLKDIDQCSAADCHEAMQWNLVTAVECSRAAIPELRRRGRGAIVNICSVSAHRGNRSIGFYPVAKAALRAYTVCLAAKLAADHIRVNSISPGPIDTPVWDRLPDKCGDVWRAEMASRIPMGRLGQPEEVAKVALFLAGPDSNWTTGTDFIVDGGMLTH